MNINALRAAWDNLPESAKEDIYEEMYEYHKHGHAEADGHVCDDYCETVAKFYVEVEVAHTG